MSLVQIPFGAPLALESDTQNARVTCLKLYKCLPADTDSMLSYTGFMHGSGQAIC